MESVISLITTRLHREKLPVNGSKVYYSKHLPAHACRAKHARKHARLSWFEAGALGSRPESGFEAAIRGLKVWHFQCRIHQLGSASPPRRRTLSYPSAASLVSPPPPPSFPVSSRTRAHPICSRTQGSSFQTIAAPAPRSPVYPVCVSILNFDNYIIRKIFAKSQSKQQRAPA